MLKSTTNNWLSVQTITMANLVTAVYIPLGSLDQPVSEDSMATTQFEVTCLPRCAHAVTPAVCMDRHMTMYTGTIVPMSHCMYSSLQYCELFMLHANLCEIGLLGN